MNYSEYPGNVRVDFFKPGSLKWHRTVAVDMSEFYDYGDIFMALRLSLWGSVGPKFGGMIAVCNEPYHNYAHPLMISWGGENPLKEIEP